MFSGFNGTYRSGEQTKGRRQSKPSLCSEGERFLGL